MLSVQNLRKSYGSIKAIGDITLAFETGLITSVVGPSGFGKTTLVRCMSGLEAPSGGRVTLGPTPLAAPHPDLAVVFQDFARALFPWMTVRQNVAFPLRMRGLADADHAAPVNEALESLRLADAADRFPWRLTGAMQQRTALARALAGAPKVLLLDDPFAPLDAQARAGMEDLLRSLHQSHHLTTILITHDVDSAIYLGDRVVVLQSRPTTVREVLEVDLPAERDQIGTRADLAYLALREHILGDLARGN